MVCLSNHLLTSVYICLSRCVGKGATLNPDRGILESRFHVHFTVKSIMSDMSNKAGNPQNPQIRSLVHCNSQDIHTLFGGIFFDSSQILSYSGFPPKIYC